MPVNKEILRYILACESMFSLLDQETLSPAERNLIERSGVQLLAKLAKLKPD